MCFISFFNIFYTLGKEYNPSLEEEQKNLTDSVYVKVNKTHHTTITAWQSPNSDNSKEVILHKEIELLDTYRIIGPDHDVNNSNAFKNIPEDNDSFYGSDKETDDIVLFSEDEGLNDKYPDSSSSDDEQITKVSKIFCYLFCIQLLNTIISFKLFD